MDRGGSNAAVRPGPRPGHPAARTKMAASSRDLSRSQQGGTGGAKVTALRVWLQLSIFMARASHPASCHQNRVAIDAEPI
jgi:hypothetical protein